MSLRDAILHAPIKERRVDVPEWGVAVTVREMTAGQRADAIARAYNPRTGQIDFRPFYADLVVSCTHDPDSGQPVFTIDDRDAVLGTSGAGVERIAAVAMQLSGLDDLDGVEAGKGSGPTESDASTSS